MGLFGAKKSNSTGIPMLDQQDQMVPLLQFTGQIDTGAEWEQRVLVVLPTPQVVRFHLWERTAQTEGDAAGVLPPDVAQQVRDLQNSMYQQGATWITAQFQVSYPQGGGAAYNYDKQPEPPLELTPADAAAHLRQFPRQADQLPQWLRELADRA